MRAAGVPLPCSGAGLAASARVAVTASARVVVTASARVAVSAGVAASASVAVTASARVAARTERARPMSSPQLTRMSMVSSSGGLSLSERPRRAPARVACGGEAWLRAGSVDTVVIWRLNAAGLTVSGTTAESKDAA